MKNSFFISKKMWLWLCVGLILLDQGSKYFAARFGNIFLNEKISFGFQFFGVLKNQTLIGFLLLFFIFVLYYVFFRLEGWTVGSSFFLAGSFSNILDRFLVGAVRDWLVVPGFHLHNNLADYWIFIGAVLLILEQTFLKKRRLRQ